MSPNYPACYVVVRDGSKVLFVLRSNTGYMDNHYSLPAGRVEENEPFSKGAVRELLEEVGLRGNAENLKFVYVQHRFSESSNFKQWVDVFFEVTEWQGEPVNTEPDKHSKVEWLDINNLPDNIMDYQKYALEQITKGNNYGEFGWN